MAHVLNEMGSACYNMGELERARSFYAEGLALSQELTDEWSIALGSNNLGVVLIGVGQLADALTMLAEALKLTYEIDDIILIATILESLGEAHSKLENFGRSVVLAGAAIAIRSAAGVPAPGYFRRVFDAMIDVARRNLSPEDFEATWQRGISMSIDDAVSYALAEQEGLSPRHPDVDSTLE
jgi:tetratricopeptide (TPR) repeat protein